MTKRAIKERASRMKIIKRRLDIFGNRSMSHLRYRNPQTNVRRLKKGEVLASSPLFERSKVEKPRVLAKNGQKDELDQKNYTKSFQLESNDLLNHKFEKKLLPDKEKTVLNLKEFSILKPKSAVQHKRESNADLNKNSKSSSSTDNDHSSSPSSSSTSSDL